MTPLPTSPTTPPGISLLPFALVLSMLFGAACGDDADPSPASSRASAPSVPDEAAPPPWSGYRLLRTLGRSGDGPGELRTPMGLDVNAQGQIAVADAGNARVEVLDAAGERVWSYTGRGENTLGRPMDVAYALDGSLWVADFERDALVHLGSRGQLLESRSGDDVPKSPAGVLVLEDGRLVVSSFYDHTLRVYGQGSARTLGGEGDSDGQFHYPTGLARGDAGALWIADSYNHRIVAFDAALNFERSLHGSEDDKLEVPVGVAWLGGVLHVADSAHHRVVALDPVTGRVLSEWRVPTEREVHTPSRIVASGDLLYVSDPANDEVYVLDLRP